jgi:hypothetical protein
MDDGKIIEIYKKLPPLRKEVLKRILVGYSTLKIAEQLCDGSKQSVTAHLKEIYKNYKNFLTDADPESKRSHLIIVFYTQAPSLVAQLGIELGVPILDRDKPRQFGSLVDEYTFKMLPVNEDEIPVLQGLGRRYFNSQDHLPTKLLKSWYEKDSNSFRKIQNKNGRTVGFFIVLFIKLEWFDQFANGNLIERELTFSKIISSQERQGVQENYIYISVVAGESGHMVTNVCMLLCLAKYLDRIRFYRKVDRLYAMAATDSGRDLMRNNLNFHLYRHATERRDGEDFFEADITDIRTSLFDYLTETFPAFNRYSSSIDLTNQTDWEPDYKF